ncbi:MAG: c-type cytochrome [Pseudomonadales bacterium]|nr:c-type cytochrome [Pseudomonadales bacterium]
MALVVALVILIAGSVIFHLVSPWYLTPLASNWSTIDFTIDLTFWITGFVFVAVNLFMAYAVYRFRYDKNRRSDYEPENHKLELWLTGITSVGVAAMLAPGLFVWADFVTVPEDAHEVEVVAQQWHWSYRFPGKDGKFGAVESRYVSDDNHFGMEEADPYGQDDILVFDPTLHIPIDKPVKTLLRSKDVLHDFAVAQFRVKMDMVPGLVSYLWFTPTKIGQFEVLCEELCGVGHHTMRGMVVVDEQEDFDAWLDSQPTYAEVLAQEPGNPQIGQSQYAVCSACHGAQGEGNKLLNAPKLAGQEEWYLRRQLEYYQSGARGTHKDDVYGKQMAPMVATLTNKAALENVVAYIASLPDLPPEHTVQGDIESGKDIWTTCGNCHGWQGEGIAALNAPRQAGMNDWYMVTQLKNFRNGVRGAHDDDKYGMQMAMMAAILQSDQRINDVVAYVNTLSGTKEQLEVAGRE